MHAIVNHCIRLIGLATSFIGLAASWLAPGMMIVQTGLVLVLFFFGLTSLWFQESVLFMHGSLFLLASAWTLKEGDHVRVDIFYRAMSPYRRAWVDAGGVLLFLWPACALGLITSLPYAYASWEIGETSREVSGIQNLWLLKAAIPFSFFLLAMQGLAMLLDAAKTIINPSAMSRN